ncbi:MAG: hypothetical protein QOD38_706, partial [Acidimicrobiaceae bacterium]
MATAPVRDVADAAARERDAEATPSSPVVRARSSKLLVAVLAAALILPIAVAVFA